jgi:hypothetical protein
MTECKITGRILPEAKHDCDFLFGVSIGQGQDFTSIAVLERFEELNGEAKNGKWLTGVRYQARHLQRLKLGVGFIEITSHLKGLIANLPPYGRLSVLVDRTDCGRPPIDHMRKEGLTVIPVTVIQSGNVEGGRHFGYRVPKKEMQSVLKLLFEANDRLKIVNSPEADELIKELQDYTGRRTAITGNDLEAWREKPSDDLVFGMMLPAWFGEKKLSRILKLPPMPRAPVDPRTVTLDELLKLQPNKDPDGILRL